jgi:hypothetical protein
MLACHSTELKFCSVGAVPSRRITIKNALGKIIGASKIARDITERKKSETQIAAKIATRSSIISGPVFSVFTASSSRAGYGPFLGAASWAPDRRLPSA